MSLLNEMLKDLNKQKAKSSVEPFQLPVQHVSISERLGRYVPWLFMTFILGLCVALIMHGVSLKKQGLRLRPSKQELVSQIEKVIPTAPELKISTLVPMPKVVKMRLTSHLVSTSEGTSAKKLVLENKIAEKIEKKISLLNEKETHDEQLNQALQAIEEEDDDRAIRLLQSLLVHYPRSISARESLSALYLSEGELQKASKLLDEGLRLTPHSMSLSMMKARLLFEQENAQAALRLLNQFSPDMNQDSDFYGLLAAVYQALGRTQEAGSLYKRLVDIEPSNGQYWLGLGLSLEERHANQQALDAYRHASESRDIEPVVRVFAENRVKILQG